MDVGSGFRGLARVQKELAPAIASHMFVINTPGGKLPPGPLLSWFEDVEQTHALETQTAYTYTGRIRWNMTLTTERLYSALPSTAGHTLGSQCNSLAWEG